jgi:3-deoxy-D-manno-octulosonic-acid transferase
MTTMTTTGAARAKALFPERVTHCYLPYDLPFAVRGFLDRTKPQLAVILETELWPNLLRECRSRGIPVVVASARISPRTANRYRKLASLFRSALADVTIAAQSVADAERFKALGAVDVQLTGNLKFDMDIPETVRVAGAAWRKQFGERFVWVAGSTHAGEEDAAIAAHRGLLVEQRNALLILVPRHPRRFDEVHKLIAKSGIPFLTRSSGDIVDGNVAVVLVDTMGELLVFYAAADVAFVGGSLVPVGGHNLLEPAAFGLPILCGPYLSNTQDIADRLKQAGAAQQVESSQQLTDALLRLAADARTRSELGVLAANVLLTDRGSLARVLQLISGHLIKN